MPANVNSKSNGTQGALQINGTDAVVWDSAGIVSGIKDASITPQKLSGGQTGSAPVFGARFWCLFDGMLTGTNAPIAGGNVSSITRTSAGVYVINFVTNLPDANYAVVAIGQSGNYTVLGQGTPTNAACTLEVRISTTGATVDAPRVMVAGFR